MEVFVLFFLAQHGSSEIDLSMHKSSWPHSSTDECEKEESSPGWSKQSTLF